MKNTILKILCYLNTFAFLLGACCLDSNSNIPAIICGISLMYLVPVMIINRDLINKNWERRE